MADDTTTLTDSSLSGSSGTAGSAPAYPATAKGAGTYFDPNDPNYFPADGVPGDPSGTAKGPSDEGASPGPIEPGTGKDAPPDAGSAKGAGTDSVTLTPDQVPDSQVVIGPGLADNNTDPAKDPSPLSPAPPLEPILPLNPDYNSQGGSGVHDPVPDDTNSQGGSGAHPPTPDPAKDPTIVIQGPDGKYYYYTPPPGAAAPPDAPNFEWFDFNSSALQLVDPFSDPWYAPPDDPGTTEVSSDTTTTTTPLPGTPGGHS